MFRCFKLSVMHRTKRFQSGSSVDGVSLEPTNQVQLLISYRVDLLVDRRKRLVRILGDPQSGLFSSRYCFNMIPLAGHVPSCCAERLHRNARHVKAHPLLWRTVISLSSLRVSHWTKARLLKTK